MRFLDPTTSSFDDAWVGMEPRLLQDQIVIDAAATVKKYAGVKTLSKLHKAAEKENLDASRERLKSDWIEPQMLF